MVLISTSTFYRKVRLVALLQAGLGEDISIDFNDVDQVLVYTQNPDPVEPEMSTLTNVYMFPAQFLTLGEGIDSSEFVRITDKKGTLRASCAAQTPSCPCRPGGLDLCPDCFL